MSMNVVILAATSKLAAVATGIGVVVGIVGAIVGISSLLETKSANARSERNRIETQRVEAKRAREEAVEKKRQENAHGYVAQTKGWIKKRRAMIQSGDYDDEYLREAIDGKIYSMLGAAEKADCYTEVAAVIKEEGIWDKIYWG